MAAFSYPPGWYFVKATDGTISLIRHQQAGAINGAQVIEVANNGGWDIADLFNNNNTEVQKAFQALKPTAKQQAAYIQQTDLGSLQKNPTQMNFTTTGGASASKGTTPVSTTLGGDADAGGINIPNPISSVSGLITAITNGALWKGVGLIIAGGLILIFAAFAFKDLASGPVKTATRIVPV